MANKENSEAAQKIAKAEKEKASKKSKKAKEGNIFQRIGKAIKRYCKDLKGEVKKITWPGAKEVLKGTVVTIVCIAIIGLVVFLVDLGLTKGINGLRTVAENRTTTTVAAEAEDAAAAGNAVDLADVVTEAANTAAAESTTQATAKAAQ